MMQYMPLRGMLSFGGNEKTEKAIELLLEKLNS